MFKPGQECVTRDGRKARIYAVDGGGNYPIQGATFSESFGWEAQVWALNGHYRVMINSSPMDLMPPKMSRDDVIDACVAELRTAKNQGKCTQEQLCVVFLDHYDALRVAGRIE